MEDRILSLNNLCKIENASAEDGFLHIEGYAAHYNKKNLNEELVDNRSFDYFFSLYNSNELKPKLTWEHTDQVIGGIDNIVSKKEGLWISARLNYNVKIVEEMIAPNIIAGDIDSFSTEGFVRNGYDGIIENKDGSYYVKDFILTAVSVVRTPADSAAVFSVANYIKEFASKKHSSKWYLFT